LYKEVIQIIVKTISPITINRGIAIYFLRELKRFNNVLGQQL
jgi:hypothetical protein